MDWMIWSGAVLSLLGVAGLLGCVVIALKARRSDVPEAIARARLQMLVVLNLGSLLLSVMGLTLVIIGIFLG